MLHREGHTLVGACISRTSMPGMRRLRRLMAARKAPLLGRPDLTQPTVQALLADTRPDLAVSWFWTRRIPPEVIALAPQGGLNVHPSLLPRHRGPDPYFWTILNGETRTGVTVHKITSHYDEGPVVLQRAVDVADGLDAWQLARRLDRPSLEALRDALDGARRGTLSLDGVAQHEPDATAAPRPSDDDCELRWDAPVASVLRRVRAASPEPGAFTAFGDATVVVLKAHASAWKARGFDPGQVLFRDEGLTVVCADGAVVIDAARGDDLDAVVYGEAVGALFPGVARV